MMKRTLLILGLALAMVVGISAPVLAQHMTLVEYETQLAEWQRREQAALQRIAQLEAEVAELQAEVASLEEQVAAVWQEIYDLLGITQADLDDFAARLDALAAEIAAFGDYTPEEMYTNRAELDALEGRLHDMRMEPPALLTQYMQIMDELQAQIDAYRDMMVGPPEPEPGDDIQYTVIRGDCLWRISAQDAHYGHGRYWTRIYQANRDQINNPDLIYPGQVFLIPAAGWRPTVGPNQYMVERGDCLWSIAAMDAHYNDGTKWTMIYEANRDQIRNPDYILPGWILNVPPESSTGRSAGGR
jgi:nucleoid-associated protein YgaU